MQFQADVLGVPVVVPEVSETTALGAAYLAGVATGAWTERDVRAMWREAARYEPAMAQAEARRVARRMAPCPRPLARVGARGVTNAAAAGRDRSSEGAGVQGPAARRALHALPRARAPGAPRLGLRVRPPGAHALPAVLLPRALHRLGQGARGRRRRSSPRTTSPSSTTSSWPCTCAARCTSWRSRSSSRARFSSSTRTAACSPSGAASATRRRSRRPTRSSSAAA